MKSTAWSHARVGAAALLVVGALTASAPAQAVAQAVKPADLMGTWARQGETSVRFNFMNDSVVMVSLATSAAGAAPTGGDMVKAGWRLAGDTLFISGVKKGSTSISVDPRTVTLKDGLLTMTRVKLTGPTGSADATPGATASRVYQRVKADTLPAQPAKP